MASIEKELLHTTLKSSTLDSNTGSPAESNHDYNDKDENNYLQYYEENISFTRTKKVKITVRDLSIGSLFSGSQRSLANVLKPFSKKIQ